MINDVAEKKKKKVKIDTDKEQPNSPEQKEKKEEGVDVKDEVEDLMKDHEKMASIQRMFDSKNQQHNLAQDNEKIKHMNQIIDVLFDMHSHGQMRHEALKRTMHYKYPEQKIQEKLMKAIQGKS